MPSSGKRAKNTYMLLNYEGGSRRIRQIAFLYLGACSEVRTSHQRWQ